MSMNANLVVALCSQNAQVLEEVINMIEADELKIIVRGEDITAVERTRIRTNLGRLLQIIEAFEPDCA